jgi:hypothetical protein
MGNWILGFLSIDHAYCSLINKIFGLSQGLGILETFQIDCKPFPQAQVQNRVRRLNHVKDLIVQPHKYLSKSQLLSSVCILFKKVQCFQHHIY